MTARPALVKFRAPSYLSGISTASFSVTPPTNKMRRYSVFSANVIFLRPNNVGRALVMEPNVSPLSIPRPGPTPDTGTFPVIARACKGTGPWGHKIAQDSVYPRPRVCTHCTRHPTSTKRGRTAFSHRNKASWTRNVCKFTVPSKAETSRNVTFKFCGQKLFS